MNSTSKPSDDLLAEARQLLEMWNSVSRQHVSIAGGCACGVGGVTLLLEDFEQDIIDFLTGQAERARRTDVTDYLAAHAMDGATGRWSVAALLAPLGDAEQAVAAGDVPAFLLERLGKTLRSFARLHG